jgi:hypothetical protein
VLSRLAPTLSVHDARLASCSVPALPKAMALPTRDPGLVPPLPNGKR